MVHCLVLTQHNKTNKVECNDAGLAGKTDLEQARADMIIDCIDDTLKPALNFMFEPDEARKVTITNIIGPSRHRWLRGITIFHFLCF